MIADVPAAAPMLQRSSIDWGYTTQPQKYGCRSRPMGRCNWARGKVMGGSSTINYLIYTRGNPRDYDEWEEMGNHGNRRFKINGPPSIYFGTTLDTNVDLFFCKIQSLKSVNKYNLIFLHKYKMKTWFKKQLSKYLTSYGQCFQRHSNNNDRSSHKIM